MPADPVDLAGVCTGDGPCVTTPIGLKRNWVTKAGGDSLYIHAIVHALMESGHTETEAERLAHGIIERWASGRGNVSPATRARAAKALAHWEAIRAASHDHSTPVGIPLDLVRHTMRHPNGRYATSNPPRRHAIHPEAAMTVATSDRQMIISAARQVEKLPDGPRKSALKRGIAKRAVKLGMKPDGDGDFDYDKPGTAPVADLAMTASARRSAPVSYPGTDKFPIRNQQDFNNAWNLRGRSTISRGKVEAWLRGVARRKGYTIPGSQPQDMGEPAK